MIKIGMIEDDREILAGVTSYLAKQIDIECVLSAGSVEAMIKALPSAARPDILLLDIGLPGMSGLSAIKWIRENLPDTDIIMFTVHDDPNRIFEALCSGATGYLLKNTPFVEIHRAIEELHRGGAPMSPQIARKVIHHFYPEKKETVPSPLSGKEKEVVIGLVDGLSYKMIADRLGVSIETVRTHIKSIYLKLHVHSKAEVITRSLKGEI